MLWTQATDRKWNDIIWIWQWNFRSVHTMQPYVSWFKLNLLLVLDLLCCWCRWAGAPCGVSSPGKILKIKHVPANNCNISMQTLIITTKQWRFECIQEVYHKGKVQNKQIKKETCYIGVSDRNLKKRSELLIGWLGSHSLRRGKLWN